MMVDATPVSSVEQVRRDFEALDAGTIDATSIYDAILRSARRYPDKIAVIELLSAEADGATRRITYADLADGITRRANVLRSLGLGVGDPVLFLPPQSIDALLAFWAAQSGAAVAPVNAFLEPKAIAEIARGCGARAIISGPAGGECGTFALAEAVRKLVPGITHHLVIAGPAGDGALDLAGAALESDGSVLDGAAPTLDDIGAFFPTGGTTGAPKIARLSHRNLLVGSFAAAHVTSLDDDHVVPAGLPLFHVGGGVIGTTRAMLLGHTLVLLTQAGYRSPAVVANFWKWAREYGFTQIITVPTAFGDLLRAYDGGGHVVRFATAGASKLPPSLVEDYREALGIDLLEGYGMTECSGFCTANPRGLAVRAGSGGLQSPFYRVKIVALDEGQRFVRDCESGELGNIAVSGPGVFQGYTDPRQTQEKLIAGMSDGERWIDAGDLGTLDADGYLWVVGRAKDLIIRGGHNIDPAPIEDALLQCPLVADAAVVAIPDARAGELPIAFVQLEGGAALDEDEIRAFCAEQVPDRAGVPVRIIALDELPRTAMRKIFKPELRRRAAQLAVDGLGQVELPVMLETSGLLFVDCPPGPPDGLVDALDRLNLRIRIRETLA
ncbi:AMP-binding protein [Sphingopyxis sp. CCNWLW253]|uniref:AMP-binding protein n=1 Tax=unclassified Sphingopyxis TaxID=2614943 RepID=UPI003012E159